MNNAFMTPEEFKDQECKNNTCFYPTRFNFLKKQNGLRPNSLHVVLGGSGRGKSTLVRPMVIDACKDPMNKACIWLTEEIIIDYKFQLNLQTSSDDRETLKQIEIFSEVNMPNLPKTLDGYLARISQTIDETKCNVLLFDNITTSGIINNLPVGQQGLAISAIRDLAEIKNIAVVVVAHTSKGSAHGNVQIMIDDVRGNATITNTSPFVYVLQSITNLSGRKDFLHVAKGRNYPHHLKYFMLNYDPDKKSYVGDSLSFEQDLYNELAARARMQQGKA